MDKEESNINYLIDFKFSYMGKVTIGKLMEILVIETQVEGVDSIVVVPKGSVIEYCSEDDWPSSTTEKDISDAVEYLKKIDE